MKQGRKASLRRASAEDGKNVQILVLNLRPGLVLLWFDTPFSLGVNVKSFLRTERLPPPPRRRSSIQIRLSTSSSAQRPYFCFNWRCFPAARGNNQIPCLYLVTWSKSLRTMKDNRKLKRVWVQARYEAEKGKKKKRELQILSA